MSSFPSSHYLVPHFSHFVLKARHVLGQTTHVRFARGCRLWWPWPKLFILSWLSSPPPASACIAACMYAWLLVEGMPQLNIGVRRLPASYLCVAHYSLFAKTLASFPGLPRFSRSSASVYYTERKPKNKKWGRPGNEATKTLQKHSPQLGVTFRVLMVRTITTFTAVTA